VPIGSVKKNRGLPQEAVAAGNWNRKRDAHRQKADGIAIDAKKKSWERGGRTHPKKFQESTRRFKDKRGNEKRTKGQAHFWRKGTFSKVYGAFNREGKKGPHADEKAEPLQETNGAGYGLKIRLGAGWS